jgi:surfeit locus 1 family protein
MLRMQFRFSWKVTLTTGMLALGMVYASVWQWNRHLQKQSLIEHLQETLTLPPIPLIDLLRVPPSWESLTFRRIQVSGSYDFQHETLLRNRNLDGRAGVHAITPLKINDSDSYLLVDRGFIPLGREGHEVRSKYQTPQHVEIFGLVKNSMPQKFMAPADPPAGGEKSWVDQWLRVDIPSMQAQLPYAVLPIYIEVMEDPNDPLLASKIVREGAAGRNDVLMMTGQKDVKNFGMESPDANYPIPTYDITPPPDIHLGYVYEWAFMALLTVGIGVIMQLKRANYVQTIPLDRKEP